LAEGCLQCLACCSNIVVRCSAEDLQREPRILAFATAEPDRRTWRLSPREIRPGVFNYTCPFLRGWGCSIYATRPTTCVRFARGSPACCAARRHAGKEPIIE
jgi:Fe-S-cluster containining protein